MKAASPLSTAKLARLATSFQVFELFGHLASLDSRTVGGP